MTTGMITITGLPMLTDGKLLKLMTWLSPSFPVGAYTYSHGVEYAVEEGLISNGADLTTWIDGVLRYGAGQLDGRFLASAYQAVAAGEAEALLSLTQLADAMKGTSEMALESSAQGRAFVTMVQSVWPTPILQDWAASVKADNRQPPYALAVGVAAAAMDVPLKETLLAYLHAFAANLISAGVRIVPLGQTAGQQATAALEATIEAVAAQVLAQPDPQFGAAAVMVDWCSMKHETQYTRLFRS